MAGVCVLMLGVTVLRRLLGGEVMADNRVFLSVGGVLAGGVAYQGIAYALVRRAMRTGKEIRPWRWVVSAVMDMGVPIASLVVLHVYSPRGEVEALSAPAILGLPLVIALSILRLRPMFTLWSGIGCAAAHWALVIATVAHEHVDRHQWPALLTYGVLLAATGAACAMISTQARAYVREAVDEASARGEKQRALSLIAHDLDVARQIQQGLMPSQPPKIAGFDVAGFARPAQETGGDYYDWQPLSDGRLVVVLADVTGHGIGPAIVMAVCRAYARAAAPGSADSAAILEQVNSLIFEDLGCSGRFVTMVIAILSSDGGVQLVSAGHGPTLLYRAATGAIERFGGDGIPLGIDAEEKFGPPRYLKLEKGDSLLLLTDGFMEWPRSDGEQFGIERLEEAHRKYAGESAEGLIKGLDAEVGGFVRGAEQRDDTTVVAVKRG